MSPAGILFFSRFLVCATCEPSHSVVSDLRVEICCGVWCFPEVSRNWHLCEYFQASATIFLMRTSSTYGWLNLKFCPPTSSRFFGRRGGVWVRGGNWITTGSYLGSDTASGVNDRAPDDVLPSLGGLGGARAGLRQLMPPHSVRPKRGGAALTVVRPGGVKRKREEKRDTQRKPAAPSGSPPSGKGKFFRCCS